MVKEPTQATAFARIISNGAMVAVSRFIPAISSSRFSNITTMTITKQTSIVISIISLEKTAQIDDC